jgi:uncharacterized protein (DUF1015 family)
VRDPAPGYYLYRLTMGAHRQTGLVAAASIDAYDADRIKRHELTRPVKEDDRVRQIDALNAQTGPVCWPVGRDRTSTPARRSRRGPGRDGRHRARRDSS